MTWYTAMPRQIKRQVPWERTVALGGADLAIWRRVPTLPESGEEAEMAVQIASTLVLWFTTGTVRRRCQMPGARPPEGLSGA
jgi:hypothetical protein